MLILGVTGGVATGKSTVTRMLADLGAPTISADALARDLLAPGTDTTRAVLAAFPGCALSGADAPAVDRRALGRRVFADSAARLLLESLTHPPIIAALTAQIEAWRTADGVAAAAEIPLLFEAGLETLVDRIVVVSCDGVTQSERLLARGLDETQAQRLLAAQLPPAQKATRAHDLIATDLGLEDTRRQVLALWDALASLV
jgi:dephospho-CoA kinase